jgi:hypothetical protein
VDDVARALRAGGRQGEHEHRRRRAPGAPHRSGRAVRLGSRAAASLDARRDRDRWTVWTHGGRRPTALDAEIDSARGVRATRRRRDPAHQRLDADGGRRGYDLELTRRVAEAVDVPVIASGGAGAPHHLVDAVLEGRADAVLLAGILHDGEITIATLEHAIRDAGIAIRRTASRRIPSRCYFEAVEALARLAGEVALRHFRTTLAIETKDDGSPVTRADREAEASRACLDRAPLSAERHRRRGVGHHAPRRAAPSVPRPHRRHPDVRARRAAVGLDGGRHRGRHRARRRHPRPRRAYECIAAARGTGCWWNGVRCHVSEVSDLAGAAVMTTDERFAHDPRQKRAWERPHHARRAVALMG